MRFAEFERIARALWNEIPAEYKEGVAGLMVDESAVAHPKHPEVYTLGECLTEDYPTQYGGPETTRSAVVLYYGSFREIAKDDDAFDWEGEIHETVMHELQHHLESLADENSLEDVDYAVDENFKRLDGEGFDPLFYRAGEVVGPGVYRVEVDGFIEVTRADGEAFDFEFEHNAVRYALTIPASDADVLFVYLEERADLQDGDLGVVRVRKRGVLATLRSAFGGGYTVEETGAVASVIS